MLENEKGDVVVVVVVLAVIALVIGLGLWAAFSTQKGSNKILEDNGSSQQEKKQ